MENGPVLVDLPRSGDFRYVKLLEVKPPLITIRSH